eukprot:COSAG03_NODE_11663_length_581_cov_1.815353_1_plen_78_part_00
MGPSAAQERRLLQLRRQIAGAACQTAGGGALLTAEKLSKVVEWSHGLVDSGELPHGAVLVAHRGNVVLADAYLLPFR